MSNKENVKIEIGSLIEARNYNALWQLHSKEFTRLEWVAGLRSSTFPEHHPADDRVTFLVMSWKLTADVDQFKLWCLKYNDFWYIGSWQLQTTEFWLCK